MRPSLPEILIVLIFLIILFGARKIPELMRSLGIGIKEFKSGLSDNEPNKSTDKENNK